MKRKLFGSNIKSLLLLFVFFSLFVGPDAFGDESGSTKFQIEILPSISISVSDVSITAGDNLTTGTSAVTISSNNQTGYVTSITTDHNSIESNATDLKHVATTEYIPTLSSSVAKSSFPTNAWGISMDDTTYYPMPAKDSTPIAATTLSKDTPGSKNANIYFGVKISNDQMSGIYKNTMLVTVVANPIPEPPIECNPGASTIAAAVCMQDMNEDVKNSMVLEQQYQLIDIRDEKTYFIAKLQDGKVWMTQNLDYDLSVEANKSLKSTTSDVTSDTTLTITSPLGSSYTALYYKAGAEQYLPNGSDAAADITCTATNNGGENCHYHLGDYYSWNAATANTYSPPYNIYTNASGSICPKGWRLPTAYGGSSSVDGDFKKLNAAYGGSTDSDYHLLSAPLFFVRSGNTDYEGSLKNVRLYGGYQSSTVEDSANSYYLSINSSYVAPATKSAKYYSKAVRCLAR